MSRKESINQRIIVTFISVTSIVLIFLGSIMTILFNKNYHSTKLSNLEKQMGIIENSINNYLNQQDGSYSQLKEIIKMACISTNTEAIITDRLGYVYLVNGEDYQNLMYSKIKLNTESLSSNIEFKKEVFKVDNASIKGYVKAIYEDGEIDGYMIMVMQNESERNFNMFIIWITVIIEIIISAIVIKIVTNQIIIRPIDNINNVAKRLAKGEVEKRVVVNCNNEIGELAESFNMMAECLEKSDTKRREFISNVSHELRSPITSIKGFIGGILDGVIPRDRENYYLKIVYDEVDRLARLVNDLLDMSAMESGKFNLAITEFDINQVISLCILNLEHKIQEKGLNVKATFHNNRAYVLGDRDRIIQVVTNIIENSIKYSNDDGEIKIDVYSKGEKIYVDIFNSGECIEEKELNKIWDRFYKSDKSRTNKLSTGLGLPIVRSILSQHNEDIWVKNIEGKGVSFIFTLKKSH
ncbi:MULTISPECIES: HAMP domain-containing sensor histidine kinase [Clostridia]|uniref:histidine kinase n=2 Tax=Clostridia TaxID=186801 RepID=A0A8I0AF47_9CLOT|nr:MULTISPECIES: HAMP domain-containing sensor histidine kinase [Clostridia]MBC5640957.1 HAMP domain-containing histidine kinase [Clostridium lentum]MBC5655189.1 HAMP domain-containing histidine kinase [Blautia lenta]CDB74050.1 sensory transduction histidine kinase [Clostridium sp. CAG:265]